MRFQMIHPREIAHIQKHRGALVVDVREPEKYAQEHFKGARNIPYGELERCLCRLPARPMILYCDYGSTSLLAARKLGAAGYEVYTVIGGFDAMRHMISIDR